MCTNVTSASSGRDACRRQWPRPFKCSVSTFWYSIDRNKPHQICDTAFKSSASWKNPKIAASFIPGSIWRVVRAKDKVVCLLSRVWGSLSALATMAENASGHEDLLLTALFILAIADCQRIGETSSIRVQDMDQYGATVAFCDRKTRHGWITRQASSYVRGLLGLIRGTTLRLGTKPPQNIAKAGPRALQATMVSLLANTNFSHLRWHALCRMGATMFIRNGATVQELMS